MNKIDQLLIEVQARLGRSRFLGRRALAELRDHLDDSVAGQLARGIDQSRAEEHAAKQIGTPEELVTSVIDASRGLRMFHLLKRHLLAVVGVLAAPGVILLGLSFLTFNFPCRDLTYEHMGEIDTYRLCGVRAFQGLRPLISEVGFYGGPAWAKWMIHILAVTGPLFASLVLIRSRTSIRRRETAGGTAEIAFAVDRKHMLALAATLSIFVTVVAYKAAS